MFEDPPDDAISMRGSQRVFKTQLAICLWIGISSFVLFCTLRYRWPHIYAVRTLRGTSNIINPLPKKFFGWVKVVYAITDDQVLEYSGLDAYVFLTFFKMGTSIFFQFFILALGLISPLRLYFTGNYDKDDIGTVLYESVFSFSQMKMDRSKDGYSYFLWVYPMFTYLFSFIIYYNLFTYTNRVLKTRQKYLASQNSITDRTIRLDGIPKKLLKNNNPQILKDFIQDLGIGTVTDIKLIYNWAPLENLFSDRKKIILELELLYSTIYSFDIDIYNQYRVPSVVPRIEITQNNPKLNTARNKVIELSENLVQIDEKIRNIQKRFNPDSNTSDRFDPEFKQISSAFITMDSVASAQMAAQTVLDPRVYKLIVNLAPAPKDVKWENFKLSSKEKLIKSYLVTFVIVLSYAFIILAVTPLTSLLDLKTIKKFYPALGDLIGKSKWLTTFVTGILPPLLFSLLNISLPYFYRYLSTYQGYASNSDIELSTLSKNFFFIFFNLFLVFIVTGTFWDYVSYISDTTKIAYQLAKSLKKLSLFYVDLILLQGVAMFPVRLLQIDDFVRLNVVGRLFFIKKFFLKTPRDYRFYYYTSQVFDFGLQLPQHILIFIIILIYSVVSTKIVTSGLVYFVLGYFVYKYQLIYNFVHPPHSTGKVWPMIYRRLMLGLTIFQLFMVGTLALEGAIILATLCSPLLLATIVVVWNFEKYYLPLNTFIALRAIGNPNDFDKEFDDDSSVSDIISRDRVEEEGEESAVDESSYLFSPSSADTNQLRRRRSTLDEEREQFADYSYPYLIDPLNGPWVGFEGDYVSIIQYSRDLLRSDDNLEDGDMTISSIDEREIVVRKKLTLSEWE